MSITGSSPRTGAATESTVRSFDSGVASCYRDHLDHRAELVGDVSERGDLGTERCQFGTVRESALADQEPDLLE